MISILIWYLPDEYKEGDPNGIILWQGRGFEYSLLSSMPQFDTKAGYAKRIT